MSGRHADLEGGREPVIHVEGLTKVYGHGEAEVHALAGVDLLVEAGEYVAVMGPSGSGKSTLMNVVGCLDTGSAGRYLLDGVDVRRLVDRQLSYVRNRKIGFIFQSFNLVPRTSALRNVELPLAYAGVPAVVRRERALAALDRVGLSDRVRHLPSELSGGQQQRVAVARAIVTDPVLLLADEPTGALDSTTTKQVMELLVELHQQGMTIVLVTHDPNIATYAERVVSFSDGVIVSDETKPKDGNASDRSHHATSGDR